MLRSKMSLLLIISISVLLFLPFMVFAKENVALGKKNLKIGCYLVIGVALLMSSDGGRKTILTEH